MKTPLQTNSPKIFISYAWENQATARQMQQALQSAGAEIFIDYDSIQGGDNLPERISQALRWCDTLILLWSQRAADSNWVKLEWASALDMKRRLIPCKLDKTPLPEILRGMVYVEFGEFKHGLAKLLDALRLGTYRAMQDLSVVLPPLPPPKDSEPQHAELTEPLVRLGFIDAVKQVLAETQPWVKYAPVDKNKPSLAHQLREQGFVFRPLISDFGSFRIAFFRAGLPPHSGLFLAINRRESNEGLVVRLWPTLIYKWWCEGDTENTVAPFLSLFYRSRNNNSRMLNVNLDWFHFDDDVLGYDYIRLLDTLLQATSNSTPNFELTQSWIENSYGTYFRSGGLLYEPEAYFFDRFIKVEKMNPIEIPWSINLLNRSSISLKYNHPVPTIWHNRPRLVSVNIDLPDSLERNSRIDVSWPQFGQLYTKLLSFNYPAYKDFLPAKDFDLVTYLDQERPSYNEFL